MTAESAYPTEVANSFAAGRARTIRVLFTSRISSENSCERFQKKFVLRPRVIRLLL
jgi:hypothetical protein